MKRKIIENGIQNEKIKCYSATLTFFDENIYVCSIDVCVCLSLFSGAVLAKCDQEQEQKVEACYVCSLHSNTSLFEVSRFTERCTGAVCNID